MSKIKIFFKKHWWVILIMIAVLPFGAAFAINTVAEGYRVSKGDSLVLDWGGGDVWNITSANLNFLADDVFIPTATQEERDSFKASELGQTILGIGGCTPACSSGADGESCSDGCGGVCPCLKGLTCTYDVCKIL